MPGGIDAVFGAELPEKVFVPDFLRRFVRDADQIIFVRDFRGQKDVIFPESQRAADLDILARRQEGFEVVERL